MPQHVCTWKGVLNFICTVIVTSQTLWALEMRRLTDWLKNTTLLSWCIVCNILYTDSFKVSLIKRVWKKNIFLSFAYINRWCSEKYWVLATWVCFPKDTVALQNSQYSSQVSFHFKCQIFLKGDYNYYFRYRNLYSKIIGKSYVKC